MGTKVGTVICPVCAREVRAKRSPGGDGSSGMPLKHKGGHDTKVIITYHSLERTQN